MNNFNYKVRFTYDKNNSISEYYIEDVNDKGFPNKGKPFKFSKYIIVNTKEIKYSNDLSNLDINHLVFNIKTKDVEGLYQANFLLCKLRLKRLIAKINKREY